MSEMVERCTEAFMEDLSPGSWALMKTLTGGASELEPAYRMRKAMRAAIAAMREPTEEMVDSAWDIDACGREEAHVGSGAGPTWRAMIDAALAEK